MAQSLIREGERGIEKRSLVKCWNAHPELRGAWYRERKMQPWHVEVAVECPHVWMEVSNPNAVKGSWANLQVHAANRLRGISVPGK